MTINVSNGQTLKATPIVRNAAGQILTRTVTWHTVDSDVAAIDSNGNIIVGTKVGDTIITATIGSLISNPIDLYNGGVIVIPPSGDGVTLLNTDLSNTPATGPVTNINPNQLQDAINNAHPGDVITVNSGSYNGVLNIPRLTGGNAGEWIIIKYSGSIPAEHSKMTPSIAAANNIPKIRLSASSISMLFSGALKVRFIGFEIYPDDAATFIQTLIGIGTQIEETVAEMPSDIIFDRCYIHGTDTCGIRHGIVMNGGNTSVIDSTVINFWSVGFDTQAIYGWNGTGAYKIHNCTLEASSEVIAFGGADPHISGLQISNVEVTKNYITKRMSWKTDTRGLLFKNGIELKTGVNVLVEGNIVENLWPQSQAGWAFVIWSVNQTETNPTNRTENITVRNNLVRNTASFAQISTKYSTPAVPAKNIRFYNNACIGLNNPNVVGAGGIGVIIQPEEFDFVGVELVHNTFLMDNATSALDLASPALSKYVNFKFNYNVVGGGIYPLFMSAGWGTLTTTSEFTGNVYGFTTSGNDVASVFTQYGIPAGNHAVATVADIGLVTPSKAFDPTATPSDLALALSSPFKGIADSGSDPGCNMTQLNAAIAGVTQ